jgi:citronellol/citronellal dehydrogenase
VKATALLRPQLLEGVSLLLAGPAQPTEWGTAVAGAFTELDARVATCTAHAEDEQEMDRAVGEIIHAEDEQAMDRAVGEITPEVAVLDVLAVDGAGLFARAATSSEVSPLRACLDATWNVTRAVVNLAFLAPDVRASLRRIVYLAPAPDAGEHAQAARAALENLARTLSVEWARHSINVVTVAPTDRTSSEEMAAITAYLASPAGAYFSGCLLDLG